MASIYKEVAMLTRLRIEMPQMTAKDANGTHAAEAAHGAHNAGVYRKNLYPKHLVDPITTLASSARAYMYSQTRPCAWSGEYLLPNRRIMAYLDQMSKTELGFWQAVTAFLNNWNQVLMEAQAQQGGMFDPTVYPDSSVLKGQFIFEYPIRPVPGGVDAVSSELDADVVDVVKAKIMQAEGEEQSQIIASAYTDLREQVLRIIRQTTLTQKETKKGIELRPGKLYESLTTDIKELSEVLRDLQCGGDPTLAAAVEAVDMHLTLPVQTLRDDPEVCRITNDKAKEILSLLDGKL